MEELIKDRLSKDGFVILDLLNEEEVNYLNTLCDRYLLPGQSDFVASSHILNREDSDFINKELHRMLDAKFSKQFPDLQLLGGTLATKVKGTSNLVAHQDWTIVDETKFNSYNLWIPLVATSVKNGTLGLIPGSHLWSHSTRGLNIHNPYAKFTDKLIQIGTEPELKAGQAILYNHRLIHFSRFNTTNQSRNVAIIGVKDKTAELQVSFVVDQNFVETYKVEESDFFQFNTDKVRSCAVLVEKKVLYSEDSSWSSIQRLYKQCAPLGYKSSVSDRSTFSNIINRFKISLGFD